MISTTRLILTSRYVAQWAGYASENFPWFEPGKFALGRTKMRSVSMGRSGPPVGVVFYLSYLNVPRNTVYRSADYSSIFPKWVWNDFECVCNAINKRKVTNYFCSKIRRLRSTRIKYGTKDCFKQCKPGVSVVRIIAECAPPDSNRKSSTESNPLLLPWFAPGVHPNRTMETQWFWPVFYYINQHRKLVWKKQTSPLG